MTLWHLELLRLTRTWRWTIVFGTYALFGVMGPVTGRYLPPAREASARGQGS